MGKKLIMCLSVFLFMVEAGSTTLSSCMDNTYFGLLACDIVVKNHLCDYQDYPKLCCKSCAHARGTQDSQQARGTQDSWTQDSRYTGSTSSEQEATSTGASIELTAVTSGSTTLSSCMDNTHFGLLACNIVVKNHLCDYQYYPKLCCKSCAQARETQNSQQARGTQDSWTQDSRDTGSTSSEQEATSTGATIESTAVTGSTNLTSCEDNNNGYFANLICDTIVRNNACDHQNFSKLCCKSCAQARATQDSQQARETQDSQQARGTQDSQQATGTQGTPATGSSSAEQESVYITAEAVKEGIAGRAWGRPGPSRRRGRIQRVQQSLFRPRIVAAYHVHAADTATCGPGEWTCLYNTTTCIPLHGKCDGVLDCPDGSDEMHAVCRTMSCPPYLFHCTYGACVDSDAKCNGKQECFDGSDEIQCGETQREFDGTFQCDNGERIPSIDSCDGKKDCADGSDETLATCADRRCAANLFQCKKGACVDEDAACDPYGDVHCADGSDEAEELCTIKANRPSTACILPQYPTNGRYKVINYPNRNLEPGQMLKEATLRVNCTTPTGTYKTYYAHCDEGWWDEKMRKCESFCKVPSYEGVMYNSCTKRFDVPLRCDEYEPNGTRVYPICLKGYRKQGSGVMECVDGKWDQEIMCKKIEVCGLLQGAVTLIMGGGIAKKNEVPWHAGIYDKSNGQYKQICGGSLVSQRLVISAAHCFWNETTRKLRDTNYAVALGQLKRQWNSGGQLFDVSSIVLDPSFDAENSLYRGDIALVFLNKSAVYGTNVRPVCVDLKDQILDQYQTADGKLGKVAGWGLTAEEGTPSDVLKVNELPTLSNLKCTQESAIDFKPYIGDDKLCAGNFTGTALCHGDSGGGLVFREGPDQPYYLRGIASIRYNNMSTCYANGYTAFTRVIHRADFITNHTTGTLLVS